MKAEEYYEIWEQKNKNKLKDKDSIEQIKNAFVAGYYYGLETQETKTAEYNWEKWNQK
jgi:ribulose bisphosphate carboxylase small subunit